MLKRTLLLLMLFGLTCCTPAIMVAPPAGQTPADLTVMLHLTANSPQAQRYYLLEPDGTLRLEVGHAASNAGYPPPMTTLSREQVYELYALLVDEQLLWEETPDALTTGQPVYDITITSDGRMIQYRTTALQTPGCQVLLQHLEQYRPAEPTGIVFE